MCAVCGKEFDNKRKTPNLKHGSYFIGPKQFAEMRFCSPKCSSNSQIGRKMTVEDRRKMSEAKLKFFRNGGKNWCEGKRFTLEHRKNIGLSRIYPKGEKHFKWKGGNVGYDALHTWVERWLGKPDTCEKCSTSNLTGHKIHWANKNHEYKRNLTDWLRLCAKCHKGYDKKLKKERKRYVRLSSLQQSKVPNAHSCA